MNRRPQPRLLAIVAVSFFLLVPALAGDELLNSARGGAATLSETRLVLESTTGNATAVSNFSAAINRLVTLVGVAGSGLLALVWTRVALSWFSNDITKKIQAKDRARDALVGTLLFVAAISGLAWGLAHYVLTGS